MKMSQCQAISEPNYKTWDEYRRGCLATFGGGHHDDGNLDAFRHGMDTVFNLLEAEFPEPYHIATLQAVREAARAVVKDARRCVDIHVNIEGEMFVDEWLMDALARAVEEVGK